VKVSFKESIDKSWLEQLSAARSVNKIDANNWQLATDNPEQLRKQIFELSLLHNLNIVSLQSDSQSLEDVFRSLTQKAE
jgi:ABC-2 type transport system ATP-binding protein